MKTLTQPEFLELFNRIKKYLERKVKINVGLEDFPIYFKVTPETIFGDDLGDLEVAEEPQDNWDRIVKITGVSPWEVFEEYISNYGTFIDPMDLGKYDEDTAWHLQCIYDNISKAPDLAWDHYFSMLSLSDLEEEPGNKDEIVIDGVTWVRK